MSIAKKIETIFQQHDIKYLKGNNIEEQIFNVPYRGISNPKNHINIYIGVDENTKIIMFKLIEKLNRSMDIEEARIKLLDLNSALNLGSLSMRSNSDTIEYKVDYQLNDISSLSYDGYITFIIKCIEVYEEMKKRDII